MEADEPAGTRPDPQPLVLLLTLSAVLSLVTFVLVGKMAFGVKIKTCQSDFKTVIMSS